MKEGANEILELYKLHVEMADRVSQRRGQINQFYTTLLSSLIAVLAFCTEKEVAENKNFIYLLVGILGITICILWSLNIISYKQLNSGKFKTLLELEEQLSFSFYKKEWDILKINNGKQRYMRLSNIERITPFVLIVPFVVLTIVTTVQLLSK